MIAFCSVKKKILLLLFYRLPLCYFLLSFDKLSIYLYFLLGCQMLNNFRQAFPNFFCLQFLQDILTNLTSLSISKLGSYYQTGLL